jgi:hypothetical protein
MRSTEYQDIVAQTITKPFPCGVSLLKPGFPDCRLVSLGVLGVGNSVKDLLFELSDVQVSWS